MSHTYENSAVQLEIKPQISRWSVIPRFGNSPSLENLQLHLSYREGRRRKSLLDQWADYSFIDPQTIGSNHGPLQQISLVVNSRPESVRSTLTFALARDHPLLLWKVSIENLGTQAINIEEIELLSAGYIHRRRKGPSGQVNFPDFYKSKIKPSSSGRGSPHPLNLAFFSNGWQSWSHTRSYRSSDQYLQTHLGFLRAPLVKNHQTPNPRRRGMFASDMFAVLGDSASRSGFLCGFLSQKKHFGSLETWLGGGTPTLRMWANGDAARIDPGAKMETDWACLQFLHLDQPDPMAPYLEAVGREHNLAGADTHTSTSPTGWCSWYQFSSEDYLGRLTARDVRENLQGINQYKGQMPLEVFQIDDGYESQIGDWLSFNEGFLDGLAPLAKEIENHQFTPGIWLAPFILHPKSRLANQHPEWVLRDRFGRPVNAGFLWNSFTQALDLTHPGAQEYVERVIQTATGEWGFSYLKLDFLYAAALPGRFSDSTLTRAQVLRRGLELVRERAGGKAFLVGCGCPLGPAIGLVDGMRIGADTARRWNPHFKGIESLLKKEASFPSAFNAVHNTLTRSDMHGRWWTNDPDCLLLRPESELTKIEVETIASVIAISGGSLIISDHVPDLPQERLNLLKSMLPIIGKRPYVLDWFDNGTPELVQLDLSGPVGSWHLLALFNWLDTPQDKNLNLNDFYLEDCDGFSAREFWTHRTYLVEQREQAGNQLTFSNVPPHGVILLALRPHYPYRPQYLGGDLHISQGLEVKQWHVEPDRLNLKLQRPGETQGRFELFIPGRVTTADSDANMVSWESGSDGIYSFDLEFENQARLEIKYT